MMTQQEQWNSPLSFVLAMIGAAVGLGNIWRYSYVVYSNGGGAFFIPYLFAILVMGIPFLILEYGIGFSFRDSFSNILKKINPKFEVISWIIILFVFIVLIYYAVILAWDLVYLGSSFNFNWGADTALYFTKTVGGSSNLSSMTSFILPTTLGLLAIWFSIWFISHRDLNNGIGKSAKVLVPILFIIMTFIIVYALTLPGAGIGIDALLHPDWSKLLDVNVWIAAFSQILFSLSMGQAIVVILASYLPEKSKLIDNVFIVVAANCLFEVFTAFGVFSILGYMSQTVGTPIVQLVSEGTGLVFVVFPEIFYIMGPVGRILAPLLFIAILFAGMSSAVAIFEPIVNSAARKLGWSRKKIVTVLSIVGCAFSLMFTTGISSYLVGVVDSFVNQFGILILVAIQCIIFTWVFDVNSLVPILNENSSFSVGKVWIFIIKYVLPLVIIVMWILGLYDLFQDSSIFELTVYSIIMVLVLVFSFVFTKINPSNHE